MLSFYPSYIKAFQNYAQTALDNEMIVSLASYALLINLKANDLLSRANTNNLNDLPVLQQVIFESGRVYVRKFINRLKLEKYRANRKLLYHKSFGSRGCLV